MELVQQLNEPVHHVDVADSLVKPDQISYLCAAHLLINDRLLHIEGRQQHSNETMSDDREQVLLGERDQGGGDFQGVRVVKQLLISQVS